MGRLLYKSISYFAIQKFIGNEQVKYKRFQFNLIIYIVFKDTLNKMTDFGYDKERFPNLGGDMFDCPICTNVVRNPKECTGCGDLFCTKCIDDWKKKNNSCPKRCSGGIQPMASKALIRIYDELDIKCLTCPKVVKLYDLNKHQDNCNKPKCWNNVICSGSLAADYGKSCSEKCVLLEKILATGGNIKQMYQVLKKYQPQQPKNLSVYNQSSQVINSSSYGTGSDLKWSQVNCAQGLQFENNCALVILKQPAYVFRTVVGSTGFTSGQHFWEIIPDSRTENELKIGVTTTLAFDLNTAFCDHVFGFAYYGLGQLRHSSNASGAQYGKRLKKEGVLGVFLNMDKGQLSFSLNGENMGVAFDNVSLKKGPIYPAVALLHCAGCTIKGGLPIPACFK